MSSTTHTDATTSQHSRPEITIRKQPFHSAITVGLVTELDAELAALYPDWGEIPHPLLPGDFNPSALTQADPIPAFEQPQTSNADDVNFYVAFITTEYGKEEVAGCGAFRLRDDIGGYPGVSEVAEVKRMYVRPGFRGMGVSSAMLKHVQQEVRAIIVSIIVLECGIRQVNAVKMYENHGFKRRADYAEWVGAGLEDGGVSICWEKHLQ